LKTEFSDYPVNTTFVTFPETDTPPESQPIY